MKTKLIVAIMLTSLLAGMLAVVPIRQVAAAGTATLTIDPATTTAGPGDVDSFFDVYLKVDTDTGLFGFDLNVTWADDTLINLDYLTSNATTATLLDGVWGVGTWFMVKSESGGGGGGGGGYYRVVALSTASASSVGIHSLINLHFQIKDGCNFYLHTHITIDTNAKLSDINYSPITISGYSDGMFEITARTPGLKFVLYEPDEHPFEFCKIFQIKVYVNQICATLKDYNLVILYDTELLKLTGVDWTDGVLGSDQTSYTESPLGTVNVVDLGGTTYTGLEDGLLFTLTFHIEFTVSAGHIWRTDNLGPLHAFIKLTGATLSFNEGDWLSGIPMPADLDITVNLIRGDVDCDGDVHVVDLRCVATFYDKTPADTEDWVICSKYDLIDDDIIDIFDLVAVATHIGHGQ